MSEDFLSEENYLRKKLKKNLTLDKTQKEKIASIFLGWGDQQKKKEKVGEIGSLNQYTVSEITRKIRDKLEDNFFRVNVLGEISQKKVTSSGYCFFTLMDENSILSAVLAPIDFKNLDFSLDEGSEVLCSGNISLRLKRGKYQLQVFSVVDIGEGAQERKYKKLKENLEKEGLFDKDKKKIIPQYVNRIALLTSDKGAVIHDFIETLNRNFPGFEVSVYSVNVGGEDISSINEALDLLADKDYDVVVLARGGGSKDDLALWNDEDLVRKLFFCPFPTISAIGHENDWVLCDLVCDARASTPTQAAMMLANAKRDFLLKIYDFRRDIIDSLRSVVVRYSEYFSSFSQRINKNNLLMKVSAMENSLSKLTINKNNLLMKVSAMENSLSKLTINKNNLLMKVSAMENSLSKLTIKMITVFEKRLYFIEKNLISLKGKMYPFSDRAVRIRGYARVFHRGEWVKRAKIFQNGETVTIEMHDGSIDAFIKKDELP